MNSSNVRNHLLRIRLSQAELGQLESLASEAGITKSELVRNHIGQTKINNDPANRERLVILGRINANLQQIARWVHETKTLIETTTILSHLIALEREISEL